MNPDPASLAIKEIPARERLIFALDVEDIAQAKAWVERLGDAVHFYKIGLQLFMADGYFEFIDWLAARGKKVFADLKFFDVPETVRLAVRQLRNRPITFLTVHGNDKVMEAAAAEKGSVRVLAVTVLTSLDRGDLDDLGFQVDVEALVLSRARRALKLGCDGVVCSGLEADKLRADLGPKFMIVTPGIRPVTNDRVDDQKRVVTVAEAFRNGADYIVVGRPIKNAPDPAAAAREIQEQIEMAVRE